MPSKHNIQSDEEGPFFLKYFERGREILKTNDCFVTQVGDM